MSVLFLGGDLVIRQGGILTDVTGIDCCCEPGGFLTCPTCAEQLNLCGPAKQVDVNAIVFYNAANHTIVVSCSVPFITGPPCGWNGLCSIMVDGLPVTNQIGVTCVMAAQPDIWQGLCKFSNLPDRRLLFSTVVTGCPAGPFAFQSSIGCTFISGSFVVS